MDICLPSLNESETVQLVTIAPNRNHDSGLSTTNYSQIILLTVLFHSFFERLSTSVTQPG